MGNSMIALIPAYEPDSLMLDLMVQLKEADMDIILVNDGSSSSYTDLFEKASAYAIVITHPVNQGKGAALKTGMLYIQNHYKNTCIIVTVDADGQHRAEDALMLCHSVAQNQAALILGSRKLDSNVPWKSRLGNTITRHVFSAVTGLHIHDTQTGLRAFSAGLIPHLLAVPGDRYEYEMNVLLEFSRKQIPVLEQEIDTIYLDNNASSHFDALRDSYRIYREILKFSISSFVGFLVDYTMYGLFLLFTGSLTAANICARLISASVNYTINRTYVFRSQNKIGKSLLQYFLLALVILTGNTIVLSFLVNHCLINKMLAKILTEILFFSVSWLVQKCIIFRKKE